MILDFQLICNFRRKKKQYVSHALLPDAISSYNSGCLFFLIKYANIIKNLTIASFLIISFETIIFISTDYSNRSIHYNLVCEWIKERGSDFISDLSRNMIRIDL